MTKSVVSIIAMIYYGLMWLISLWAGEGVVNYIFLTFLKEYGDLSSSVKMFMLIVLTSICYKAIKSLFPSLEVTEVQNVS